MEHWLRKHYGLIGKTDNKWYQNKNTNIDVQSINNRESMFI